MKFSRENESLDERGRIGKKSPGDGGVGGLNELVKALLMTCGSEGEYEHDDILAN